MLIAILKILVIIGIAGVAILVCCGVFAVCMFIGQEIEDMLKHT